MSSILIVDDALFMRTVLRNILEKAGYTVAGEAEDGTEAVKQFRKLKPTLVTLDIIMPGDQGLQVLKEIKALNSGAKVVIVSALGQKGLVDEALNSGASGYIVKPFQEDDVLEEVGRQIGPAEDS